MKVTELRVKNPECNPVDVYLDKQSGRVKVCISGNGESLVVFELRVEDGLVVSARLPLPTDEARRIGIGMTTDIRNNIIMETL